ncbi:uncharacterized protein LOC115673859 isoform X1 [Syzygium oleosum]|uniref:uncharacterized protein LOC115673859 isoform X1 n=1 Tax=Syzygium oleosum TaxID=219896 RepID=UPI0011D21E3E|nr:uncharacterized protein LOC115673859 isoform X1 [Syzygium oleosum]
MANPGVGTKFVSVNLNKSYGQHAQHHQGSSYGQGRTRVGGHGGGGGGGGMVVLSRPRSSQKAGPKLSVPPPLNLPSLRKEHEKFDTLGTSGSAAGGGVNGSGMRPGSSGMGWTKSVNVGLQEKEVSGSGDKGVSGAVDLDMHSAVAALNKGGSAYMPPSARSGPVVSAYLSVEKVTVLRGEDFPSLRAAVPAASGSSQRQKDGLNLKQKQLAGEDAGNEQRPSSHMSSLVDMRPQVLSSRHSFANGVHDNGDENHTFGSSRTSEQSRKQDDYFSGPLPLVRLNPRSDWADDERDTSRGLIERGRDNVFPKSEAYWDGDFDMPKASFLPHKPAHGSLDRWGQRDNETGKYSSSEVHRADPYGRDVGISGGEGREGSSWRISSPIPKGGAGVQESRNDRNNLGVRSSMLSMETKKDNKHVSSPFRDGALDDLGRKEIAFGQGGRLSWSSNLDSFNSRGTERIARDRNGSEQFTKYPGDGPQSSSASKSSSGGKGLPPLNDPILNFTKDKRPFSKNEKPYLEDPFLKDYGDGRDSGSLVGVVKRKKDMLKQADFYDPVRESFEAELERVQKMQEQERQRILEEQERALELARREEEERARLAKEQEEMQRRLEEEAKEAAWRAEQERLEALRRAEEQRIAREEEKRRVLLEEERRKQAAKQKLLELEERMAKRQAETVRGSSNSLIADERYAALLKEKDTSRVADTGDWEDSENMVERITTPASSDSSTFNRTFDMGSRPTVSQDSSISMERGKLSNSWRRDPFETGSSSTLGLAEQEGGPYGPRRDASHGGKTLQRKEFNGAGSVSYRSYNKGGMSEPQMDDFPHTRGHRWNLVDGDPVNRNPELDPEFHENFNERFAGDVGWGHSRPHGYPYPPSSEQFYQNSEADGSYSFGRSRYSMRQPRVLPPPSLSSMHKNAHGGEIERPGPSSFRDNEMHHTGSVRSGSTLNVGHGLGHQEDVDHQLVVVEQESTDEQKLDPQTAPRCDSQSSLSVSSPPDSPIHLSHDDLDESGDYSVKLAAGQDGGFLIPEKEAVVLPTKAGQVANAPRSISSEDEGEWTEENNELLQEQEEYDEDEEGYQEEDEVREADDEMGDRHQEFDDIHLENESSAGLVDNLVLGFNEGVEVPVPSDEYEQSPRNREVSYAVPSVSLGHGQEEESSVRLSSDVRTGQHVDGSPRSSMDASSRLLQEAEKAMQGLVIKPNNIAVTSAASQILDNTDAPVGHVVPSSSNLILHSTAPAVATQAEAPKLQFGLFSGPSLIPSPVPAIQIGSIQMPLHLHPQVTPSLSPMQQAHTPIFQFGQLRYSSAFTPGIVSMASPVSLVRPNVPANFPFNHNQDGSLSVQPSQDIPAQNLAKMDDASLSAESQPGVPRHLILPHDKAMKNLNPSPARVNAEGMLTMQQDRAENSQFLKGNNVPDFQLEEPGQQNEGGKNYKFMSNSKKWEGQGITGVLSSQAVRKEKDFNGSKVHGSVNGGKVKHYVFKVKNPASRSSLPENEVSQSDSSGYQRRQRRTVRRTEFRVRENGEKRRSAILGSPSLFGLDDRSSVNARSALISGRIGSGKAVLSGKLPKRTFESESIRSGSINTQEMESRSRNEKRSLKESISKSQSVHQPLSLEQIPKSNVHEEDIDAPLQSGIVRVFQQSGIEAPSDEDDFIEVRSKRQMLNDKREQREKEIKAKSRVEKVPRKSRPLQNTDFPSTSKRISSLRSGETVTTGHIDFATADGRGLANIEVSVGFSALMVSQPLAPIGTPAAKTETQADSVPQKIMSLSADIGKNLGPGSIFESKNKVMDDVQPLDSWGNSGINQQVMSLTQSQLDEAMKPAKFDARVSVGESSFTVTEGSVPLTSISAKDKSFSSAASPINSLLAGEKIQFGAVTSPTVLPPTSHALSHGIGPPNSCLPDVQVSHKLSAAEDGCIIFFEKDKNSGEPCVHLEDSEAEAEAAASAVAVAAISSDEIVGNGLGRSVSVSDAKTFGAVDVDGICAGVAGDQESANHLRAEEPLNVSLPADLSVETPPISLWQPLTSSQSTSSQMLSHFPGGPPSHFPFYEMNPMMGNPIFAFGPNEESASTQQQSQKSSAPNSGPHGSWPQCHSGVDSFYGPPAGFTGPFISPGGIPGVQGPPHMVVYNHFAPVGQFGQVGLSFMGTTFIPSGRQPDWKHNPASAPMVGEGDMNNLNVVPTQRNPANMPTQMQHLAPGSPLLPIASPMFDVPPFQTNPEMSVHARWTHLPASPLQSSSMSLPMQQQAGALPPQFNNGPSVDQSLAANRFAETRTSTPESSRNFPVATDASDNRLAGELGLLDPSSSSSGASTQSIVAKNSPLNASINAGNVNHQNGSDNDGCGSETAAVFENKSSQQRSISSQNYSSSSAYNYPRGGPSQKGNEWPHRRTGFQGRNHSFGSEKSFASSKVKQVYVAKQTIGGKTATS